MNSVEANEAAPAPTEELGRTGQASAEPPGIPPTVLTGSVRLVDSLAVSVLGAASYGVIIYPYQGITWSCVWAIFLLAGAAVAMFQTLGIYTTAALQKPVYQYTRVAVGWTLMFLLVLAVRHLFGSQLVAFNIWLASWFGAGLLVLLGARLGLNVLVQRWAGDGRLIRRCAIVGGGPEGESLLSALKSDGDSDLRICGVFDDRAGERSPLLVAGVPKLGTVDDLVRFTRLTRIDLVLVSLPLTAEERVLQMVQKLWVLPVDVRLAAHMSRLRFRPRAYSYIGRVPVLPISDKPISDWNLVLKAIFDRVAASLMLIALAPVLVATAVAIKLDSNGPIFFRQRRLGFNNEVIEVLKFRSLYQEHTDREARRPVTKGDPRVTPVGRFIRRASIDELPQLFNVLRGELSLVGPRPHAIAAPTCNKIWEEVVDGYFARHRVKPGLTGWAQVNGWRGELNAAVKLQRRVEHDLYYIENWSLLFDIYILLRTPVALLKAENAY
jgi:Undecaprenyl-phosphate glucose phosphotransferase